MGWQRDAISSERQFGSDQFASNAAPRAYIRRWSSAIVAACLVVACSPAEIASPPPPLAVVEQPQLNASVSQNGSLTVWSDGKSFTLDSAARIVSSSVGLRVGLDLDAFAGMFEVFQAVVEGDILSTALEDLANGGPVLVDPYRTDERGNGGTERHKSVYQSGDVQIVISAPKNEKKKAADGVSTMDGTVCSGIAGALLNTVSSFRTRRTGWAGRLEQLLIDFGVAEAIAAVPIVGRQYAGPVVAGVLAGGVGAEVVYSHWNMAVMGTMWNSHGCSNRRVEASGFLLAPGSPPGSGPFGGTSPGDGIIFLLCEWKQRLIEVSGQTYWVDVRICEVRYS